MYVKYLCISDMFEEIFEVTIHTCYAYVIPIMIVWHIFIIYVKVQWHACTRHVCVSAIKIILTCMN